MTVRFRLLGEVEVLLDGRPLDTGHARQRCVLAALLVEVNRAVTADELIERVWGGRPPHRARNALSAYVSRLRQALAGLPEVRVGRGAGGYVLTADPLLVDLHEFRDLVGGARAADRTADAVALYARALSLWRGEPLAAIDTPWFDDVRALLLAERFAVVLDRNDAALRAGRHADVLVELADAARAHPLDERLAGQLMLAQHRSGRQGEALGTYQAMRERLRDELGVDPGAALRRVHQQILTGDAAAPAEPELGPTEVVAAEPAAAAEAIAPAAAAEPVVSTGVTAVGGRGSARGLPRRMTSFVGRRGDIERVMTAFRAGRLVTLTGVGGVGKSRLAVEAAAHVGGRTDGVWWCELAPLEDGGPVSHVVAAALHLQQRQGSTIEQTVIEYLRDRELLLVVDNCEHVLEQAAGLLEQVVRCCPAVMVLTTSREPLGVEGERIVPVDPLPPEDAAALFTERARAARPSFDPDGEVSGAVVEICRRLDGLPLGIELAAARMRAMNAAEVASRLASPRFVRGGSRAAPARHQSLAAAVDWSYRLLPGRERVLFDRLSVFAGRFDLDAAHCACAEPDDAEEDTLELLAGLVDKSMVSVHHAADVTWYRLLETMRQYGRERLVDRAGLDEARERHARYVLDLAERAGAGLLGADEDRWVELLLRAYDDLRVAVRWAIGREDADLALRLVVGLADFAYWRVGFELADWSQEALQLPEAATHRLAPAVLGVAARGAWLLGDFRRAAQLAHASGMPEWVETSSRSVQPGDTIGVIDVYEGRREAALLRFQRRVELARLATDPLRLNWALCHLALTHAFFGNAREGRLAAEEALAVAREAGGNPSAVGMALLSLGRALQGEEPRAALALLEEGAETFASVHSRWFVAYARMYAAATHVSHSDTATATGALLPVLDEWEQLGDRSQQWLSLLFSAQLLVRLGADAEAVTLHHALVTAGQPALLDADRLTALAESLGAQRFDAAAGRGLSMDGPAAIAFARSALHSDGSATG